MKQTKFMQVMFSAVENGDEELTSQVANDIETAKAEGNVETDEVSYNNLGEGKVLVIDKVNKEATIAEMPEDEAATYDLMAVPDEELDKFLYPQEDGVTPDEGVNDFVVPEEHAPFDDTEAPSVEEEVIASEEGEEENPEQTEFSVSTDNEVVLRIFSDTQFYDRLFSEVLESEETSVVGDLKIEKVDDDTVVVTSQSTGDQAAVTLDDDEMEVKELDQKEMSYSEEEEIEDEEPALYSVILDEDELNFAQYLFGEADEEEIEGEEGYGEEELEDEAYEGDSEESFDPMYVVGIDADNHQIVDAPVYNEEQAQELSQHLTEIGVDGVSVFDSPGEARDYAEQLLESVGVPVEEEAATDEPVEQTFSDYLVYTTRYYSYDELEEATSFMMKCYSEDEENSSNTEKIEDAIERGSQVETNNEIITPVDSETAVVEDKNTGEFTKATMDEEGIDLKAIDEEEASKLTEGVVVDDKEDNEAPEEDAEEEKEDKEFSEYEDDFEFVTNFGMRLYSDDEEAHENVEDAIESGEEIETKDEVITPVDSETAIVKDKNTGEFTKVTVDEKTGDKEVEAISKEEAEELYSHIEVEPTDEEIALATATRFFADAMAPQQAAAPVVAAPVAAPQQEVPAEAVPVDENGNPIEEETAPADPATQSVEAIEDKALVAVQSIQAAANDAVMAIQQAKEAPAPGQEEDLQEAQFSNEEDEEDNDSRLFSDNENTLTNWLSRIIK